MNDEFMKMKKKLLFIVLTMLANGDDDDDDDYDDYDACHCVKSQDEEGHQDCLGSEEADRQGEHDADVVVCQDHNLMVIMMMMMTLNVWVICDA